MGRGMGSMKTKPPHGSGPLLLSKYRDRCGQLNKHLSGLWC